jgi:hypothetical protein
MKKNPYVEALAGRPKPPGGPPACAVGHHAHPDVRILSFGWFCKPSCFWCLAVASDRSAFAAVILLALRRVVKVSPFRASNRPRDALRLRDGH